MRSPSFSSFLVILLMVGAVESAWPIDQTASPESLAKCIATDIHENALPKDPSEESEIISDGITNQASAAEEKIKDCEDEGCVQRALDPIREKAKDILDKISCLKRNPAALNALVTRLVINEGSWASTWVLDKMKKKDTTWRDFPYEYAFANLVLIPVLTIKSCKRTFESGVKGAPPRGWKQLDWSYVKRAMANNLPVLSSGMVLTVGANMWLDKHVRHKEVPNSISHYAAKAALLTVEQSTASNLFNVAAVDPFLKVELPKMAGVAATSSLKDLLNPKVAAVALGGGLAAKTLDFEGVTHFMNLTQVPAEKLLRMSWSEIEKLLSTAMDCPPEDMACQDFIHSSATSPNM